ncbi:MAG: ABC transporter ATP-binding protein [Candidatus Thorarchaeota archaeon]
MNPVEVKSLVKTFDRLIAVNNLTFNVREGEIYGLLGPNGAGKTTTLKVLMGLLDPDSGTASIFGFDSTSDPIEVKKRVGYVPEEQLLYNSLTSKEILDFVASVRGLDYDNTRNRVNEMIRALDFSSHFGKPIVTLSQGNKQKAMLLIAMMHAPDLLILDEPFSGLDVRTTRIMKDVIRIHTDNGGSVLFSTHIMEMAEGLCDRVGIIDDGVLVAEGTLDELRTQSESEGATLENVFLKLTGAEEEVRKGVDALREALDN